MKTACIKHNLIVMALAVFAGLAAIPADALVAARMPETSKMNILFIIVEDWNAGTPGCYGNPICKTPNLALEAEMHYVNFTTRHRGNLYMFRTSVSEFTSLNSPARRGRTGRAMSEEGTGAVRPTSRARSRRKHSVGTARCGNC